MVNLDNLFLRLRVLDINSKTLSVNTGISTGNISDWKSGRSMPTAKKLVAIADYLNCSVDYLLGRTDIPNFEKGSKTSENYDTNKKLIISLFEIAASAGTGNWLEGDVPTKWITVPRDKISSAADFCIRISGDSMQPDFSDGEIVFIKKSPSIIEGEIGVFIVNSESFIKKMGNGELISLNLDYETIKLTDYDDVRYVGKVTGKLNM